MRNPIIWVSKKKLYWLRDLFSGNHLRKKARCQKEVHLSRIACLQLEEKSTAGPSTIGDNLDRRVAMFLLLNLLLLLLLKLLLMKLLLLLLWFAAAAAAWLTSSHKKRRRGGTSVGGVCWTQHTRGGEERETRTRTEPEHSREEEGRQGRDIDIGRELEFNFIHSYPKQVHNHVSYRLQVTTTTQLPTIQSNATHYHHSHITEIHANTKENTRKYSKKYTEIQIKVKAQMFSSMFWVLGFNEHFRILFVSSCTICTIFQ